MASITQFEHFDALCKEAGITPTHQRLVIWQTLQDMHHHPTPEDVYKQVKSELPTISLATVYKNIHLFIDTGLFSEVSLFHGTLRIETNSEPHHHLVCRKCKAIFDLSAEGLSGVPLPQHLPGDFVAEQLSIEVLGICAACRQGSPLV